MASLREKRAQDREMRRKEHEAAQTQPQPKPRPIMDSYLVNHSKIRNENISVDLVSLENVHIGLRVKRGLHWRASWKDDIDRNDTNIPKNRLGGTIIGYTNNNVLVGENSNSIYHTDKITTQSGPGWAVVRWDNNNESVYPIGAENLYTLGIED